jgi:ribosomal protein S12 methylthiotransferase
MAALLPDQVPTRTRRARAQRLRDLADDIGLEQAAAHVGQVLEVLVEGMDEDDDVVVGRLRGQAPEIDGIVLLDRGAAGQVVSANRTYRIRLEGRWWTWPRALASAERRQHRDSFQNVPHPGVPGRD